MPSFTQLLSIASLALLGSAAFVARSEDAFTGCANPSVVSDSTIQAGNLTIQVQDFSCGSDTDTGSLSRRAPKVQNVCGVLCNNACTSGNLPPIKEDCEQISDALQIFNGIQSSTFVTSPGHVTSLTSGTCSFFFSNLRTDYVSLEFCWSDLSNDASSAASTCFPPIQPLNSAGSCEASDGTWLVGAAHS